MKYKTVSLSYCNGEDNLIQQMSHLGYGLTHKQPPDYPSGNVNAYYTFCGGDGVPEIERVDFRGDVTVKTPKRLGFLGRIQKLLYSSK